MNFNLSIFQRFLSETPDFWKKTQLFGAFIVLLAAVLAHFALVPSVTATVISTVGYTVVAAGSLAVKDAGVIGNLLEAKQSIPDGILQLLSDLPAQIAEVKAVISAPSKAPSITEAINAIEAQTAPSQPAAPVAAPVTEVTQ